MSFFNRRRKKVDIQILRTDPLTDTENKTSPKSAKEISKSPVQVNIIGKQQLGSSEEILAAAEQAAQEFSQLALPQIVLEARKARENNRFDQAIIKLRQYLQLFAATPEIETELNTCLSQLDDKQVFQRVPNSQLAAILFDDAGFKPVHEVPVNRAKNLLEIRQTYICQNPQLRHFLQLLVGSPQSFYCYSLAEYDKNLGADTLEKIADDYKNREITVNGNILFVICKSSTPETNLLINGIYRFTRGFTAIPLEREEMQRAIIKNGTSNYLQSKVGAWLDNHRLFVAVHPVVRQGEFFGRKQESNQIKSAIEKGESFYIVGSSGIGKTSLIHNLHNLGAFRDRVYAYIETGKYTEDDDFQRATLDILHQWRSKLEQEHPQIIERVSAQILSEMTPLKQLNALIEGLRNIERNQVSLLLIVDDLTPAFDAFEDRDSLWKRGLQQFLRYVRTWNDIVVAGLTMWNFNTADNISLGPSSGIDRYKMITAGPLKFDDCRTMVEYIGGIINMRFESAGWEEIFAESGGHPLWTRLLCDAISRTRFSRAEQLTVTPEHVMHAAEEFMSVHGRFIKTAIQSLETTERQVLKEMSRFNDPVMSSEIPGATKDILIRLEQYGWISAADDRYQINMRLLARYLRTNN